MRNAYKLAGSTYAIDRDYPHEIQQARKKLWPEYKRLKRENRSAKLIFPAAVCVGEKVIYNEFPGWDNLVNGRVVNNTRRSQPTLASQALRSTSISEPVMVSQVSVSASQTEPLGPPSQPTKPTQRSTVAQRRSVSRARAVKPTTRDRSVSTNRVSKPRGRSTKRTTNQQLDCSADMRTQQTACSSDMREHNQEPMKTSMGGASNCAT
ncbi:hypothetical protein ACF0H5_004439 [Mactra antiquata]